MPRFVGESIRYPIRTTHDRDEMAPCIIAGPTCDSVGVLYEKEGEAVTLTAATTALRGWQATTSIR
jgi:hypothetical protein